MMATRCEICGAFLGPDDYDICDVCFSYYLGDAATEEGSP